MLKSGISLLHSRLIRALKQLDQLMCCVFKMKLGLSSFGKAQSVWVPSLHNTILSFCKKERVFKKKNGKVHVGTGAESIIIAVRITPESTLSSYCLSSPSKPS